MTLPMSDPAGQQGTENVVGFIGLGVMGGPMALHIARDSNADLHVTARRQGSASPVIDAGATWHETARDLAEAVDVVIVMVPDLPDVRSLLDGDDGLLAGADAGLLLVICSTVSPRGVRELDFELRSRTQGGVRVVDAPVSGGEDGAIAGNLVIMLGGDRQDTELTRHLLAPVGTAVHLGPVGSGQVAKACNQMVVAATVTALAEASVIAERAGLNVGAMFELLGGGFAGSRLLEAKKHRFATHDHSPSGPAKFMIKDLGFAADEAEASDTLVPQLDVLRELFTAVTEAGMGDLDTSVMQAFIEQQQRG